MYIYIHTHTFGRWKKLQTGLTFTGHLTDLKVKYKQGQPMWRLVLAPKVLGSFHECAQLKLCTFIPSFVRAHFSFARAEAKCVEKGKEWASNQVLILHAKPKVYQRRVGPSFDAHRKSSRCTPESRKESSGNLLRWLMPAAQGNVELTKGKLARQLRLPCFQKATWIACGCKKHARQFVSKVGG